MQRQRPPVDCRNVNSKHHTADMHRIEQDEHCAPKSSFLPRLGRRSLGGTRLLLGLIAAFMVLGSACARRVALTPSELQRVRAQAELATLRVYPERRMALVYRAKQSVERYRVDKAIVDQARHARIKTVVARGTPGVIIAVTRRNDMPMLWVSFDPACDERACALGFVQTEADRFRLAAVPKLIGYGPARVRGRYRLRSHQFSPSKIESLAEANTVWALERGGHSLTIELEVKKLRGERTHTRTHRSRGIR